MRSGLKPLQCSSPAMTTGLDEYPSDFARSRASGSSATFLSSKSIFAFVRAIFVRRQGWHPGEEITVTNEAPFVKRRNSYSTTFG